MQGVCDMSGGSLDYSYRQVSEAADRIRGAARPLHRAFAEHLDLVSKAMHDLEWVMSCDTSPGSEDDAIRACLPADAEIHEARKMLEAAIETARKVLS